MNVESIVREYIDKTVHMSLATVSGDAPWVCEVHFAYDNELNLYFISSTTRRHSREIAANPKVAGNIIDKYALGEPVVGLYFEGRATLLEPGPEQNMAALCLKQRLNITADIVAAAAAPDGHKIYQIAVANWYAFGKFGAPSGQKLKLEWKSAPQ
jgi:uncharacterized protein YhbP (UPF0306 family)